MTMPPTAENAGHSSGPKSSVSGTNLSTRIGIVWRRGKINISRLLAPPEIPTAHESTCRLPYEIVEIIITHIAHDTPALKACSLTCHSWYTAVVPHLHYTLILTRDILDITRRELRQLSKLHRRGLMPLMKEIRVEQWRERWFTPQAFSPRDLRYFSAFANVQTLRLQNLDISHFIPGVERYFGHFSPTLRSIRLMKPSCTPIQLSHFLSLFPNLDDIKIREIPTHLPNPTIPDTELVPFSTPRLRGRLVLRDFDWAATWTHFIASGGSLRFHYMDLHCIGGCIPVLFDACAETLETLRFYAWDYSGGVHSPSGLNLSRLKVLRSLEVGDWPAPSGPAPLRRTATVNTFSTITSPVFSELVIIIGDKAVTYLPSEARFLEALRTMRGVRPFKLVFLLMALDETREEQRQKLEGALDAAIARGLFDFLDSPPTIRSPRFHKRGWDMYFE